MSVAIRLLGGFAVEVDGRPTTEPWRLRKARTLVKVLALEPGRRLHREQAMELLWPELGASAAQNNLHQALHAARRVLGAEHLTLEDGMLALPVDVRTDLDEFEALAAAARVSGASSDYAAALERFGGELLPEDRYEAWADGRRAAVTDLHSLLCLELSARQPPADAVATLQRALSVDPLHEPAHRELMRTYDRLGRRQDALAQYNRLRASLRRALEADPADETRALYRELLARDPDADALAPQGLPAELTTFVGRERELREIAEQLAGTRLLTLVGPGGGGKTRLAIAAAERAGEARRDGVVFVELSPVTDPLLVGDAVAAAIGITVPAKRAAADAVADQLAGIRALLVLDTCEHVVEACAELAETLLERCPDLTILATSRERLRCRGERAWQVPGLAADESLQLFVERARDVDPAFEPAGESRADLEQLCARLDGMPLALEMAAARVQAFAPAQIAARLSAGLDILSGGRTGVSRQQTLRATISWSHELLDGEQRVLFRRLSVFAGTFSLDAATEVCAGGSIEPGAVAPLLLGIVEKSLAVVEDVDLARYRLLDTVRQFAAELLDGAGERDPVEARLRDWASRLAADPPPLRLLELDHDNLRAALDSASKRDPQGALRLAVNIWPFWLDRSYFTEGARRMRAALDAAPEPTELRAHGLLAAAALELRCGRLAAFMSLAREAAALATELRPALAADILHRQGLLATAGATLAECTQACEQALALAGDEPVRASILSVWSLASYYLGDAAAARARLEAALDALGAVPATVPPFFEGVTFGFAILPEGPGGRLRPFHEESIFLFRRFDRDRAVAYSLCNLALLARAEGRRDDAEALLDEALMRFRRVEDRRGEAHALAALGNWARTFGEPDRAVELLDSSVALRRANGDRRALGIAETAGALARAHAGDLAAAEAVFARTHDHFRVADDAPGQGGALTMWGLAYERAGDAERAADLVSAGAEVWERGLEGPVPGWGLLAAADMLLAAGRQADAAATLVRAERVLAAAGETRGVALCAAHPAHKSVQRSR